LAPNHQMVDKQSASLRIDLSELETFLAVVELGSFSAAATRMHISQPSITARVQRLEERLQSKLLSRTTRKVEPTKAGQRLFDAATVALAELRAVVHEFDLAADRGGHKVLLIDIWMMHAWVVPGFECSWGVFSGECPELGGRLGGTAWEAPESTKS